MKISRRILSGALALSLSMALTVPAMAASPFSDIPENAWYAQDVAQVQELGIFNGKGNNQFDPQGTLTIAEAIALTARTRANYNNEAIPTVQGAWYQSAVDYATKQGIINGSDFTDYSAMATRTEMAYLFAHALPDTEYQAISTISKLPDVDSNSKYTTEIFRLYNAGILTGSDKYGNFNPHSVISRAETAVILNRVVNAETRKTVSLEPIPQYGYYTPYDDGKVTPAPTIRILMWNDPSRPYAREGDIFVAKDGTQYKLTLDARTGVVGYGQPVATDLGRTQGNQVVKDGGYVLDLSRPELSGNQYQVNHLTGEGHFNSQWSAISREYTPDVKGIKDGQLSADKNFIWIESLDMWTLVVTQNVYE